MLISREQARAARSARGWTVRDAAAAVAAKFKAQGGGVSFVSIGRFERGETGARAETLNRLQKTYEAEGLQFSNGDNPGVSWDACARERWAAADKPKSSKPRKAAKAKRSNR